MHFKNRAVDFKIRKKNGLKFEFETLQRYLNGKKELFKILQPFLQSTDLLKEKGL